MNVLIIGASAGLGRALAEVGAKQGHNLLLAASDTRDLEAIAADLSLRFGVGVEYVSCHLDDAEESVALIAEAARASDIDGIMAPAGFATDTDLGDLDIPTFRKILDVNFISIATIIAALWPALECKRNAFVIGFGSVASIRGRKRNIFYSAAKRALTSYFESLQHRSFGTPICVRLYQMGYIETQQSFGKKLLFPLCNPARAAVYTWSHVRDSGVVFFPPFWQAISFALRLTPSFVLQRLNF